MKRQALPAFLAVSARAIDETKIHALTPRVMQWDDDVWLFDLRPCQSYWSAYATWQKTSPQQVIQSILEKIFAAENDAPPAQEELVRRPLFSILGESPWQALLLLAHLRDRQLSGFVNLAEPFGQSLYKKLSWHSWYQCAARYGHHVATLKRARFKMALFQKQLRQMEQAIHRLNLTSPWQLESATTEAMKRRFGRELSLLWEWTFIAKGEVSGLNASSGAFDDGFPWLNHSLPVKPAVRRHLEHPLWTWEHVAPLLTEDLDRLCGLASFGAHERVVSLAWDLTLGDMTTLPVAISFRHPHALHKEQGHHRTALLQAGYCFETVTRALAKTCREEMGDMPAPVVSWQVMVAERLTLPELVLDLFGAIDGMSPQEARLCELENRLPVGLEQYDLAWDWLPEASFAAARKNPDESAPLAALSLLAAAKERPFYIYETPRPLSTEEKQSFRGQEFLERTTVKWWLSESERRAAKRDYYRLVDHQGSAYWVFQDMTSQWYVHGVFA